MAAAGLVLFFSSTASADRGTEPRASCETQEVIALVPAQPASGSSTFCVTPNGLRAEMRVADLVDGDPYTVWWVYFDDPGSCATPGECGIPDLGGDNPLGVFGRMDSAVPGPNGRAHLSGRVNGMRPSDGAQLWLLVFGHGPADYADGRHLARQLLTPEDPPAGAPHLGNVVDGALGFPVVINVFTTD